ncbi:MAG: GNAT family N-acetyltransferase [Mycobacteriales bacterium]
MTADSKIGNLDDPHIRSYRESDLADLYDVCVRTGANGQDARGMYDSDELLGDLYAAPYGILEPETAFVVEDGGRVVGYIIGARDTRRFVAAFREQWLPQITDRYPPLEHEPATPDERIIALLQRPEHMLVDELLDAYPAHLHIDLLADYQGRGLGKKLMRVFLDELAESGVPGVHLGVGTDNTNAMAFYDRMGFTEVPIPRVGPGVAFLVRLTR